jgi:hypothetical protein
LLFEIGSYFFAFVLFPFAVYTLYTERTKFDLHHDKPSLDAVSLEETS